MELNRNEDMDVDFSNKIKRYGLERSNYAFIKESQLNKLFGELQSVIRDSSCETTLSADSDIHDETIPANFFPLKNQADRKIA